MLNPNYKGKLIVATFNVRGAMTTEQVMATGAFDDTWQPTIEIMPLELAGTTKIVVKHHNFQAMLLLGYKMGLAGIPLFALTVKFEKQEEAKSERRYEFAS